MTNEFDLNSTLCKFTGQFSVVGKVDTKEQSVYVNGFKISYDGNSRVRFDLDYRPTITVVNEYKMDRITHEETCQVLVNLGYKHLKQKLDDFERDVELLGYKVEK